MEELTENAEEPDDGDSKKEEQKLGKLQYKVGVRLHKSERQCWVTPAIDNGTNATVNECNQFLYSF
jgi:hypothetical protein